MTRPKEVADLDQAIFFIYPDSGALKTQYESLKSSTTTKEFMDAYLRSLWNEIQSSFEPSITKYFWHDEGIHWELVDKSSDPFNAFIHAKIRFGDGMEDEWFILELLMSLTAKDTSLVASIFDTDGDFILIEAADALPDWLEPDNSRNRVFIHDGTVKIIPIETLPNGPTLQEALKFIRSSESRANGPINAAIKGKVNEKQVLHHAQVRIPLRVAQILNEQPNLIASAVSAFYNREPEAMRICTEMPNFNPNKSGGSLLTTTVPMTRIQFAQLACQEFVAPSNASVNFDIQSCDNQVAVDLGVKLACGFEILMSQSPKYVTKNLFDSSPLSIQGLIQDILAKPLRSIEDLVNNDPEDPLDWMEISQEALDSELNDKMNRLSMNENEESELLNNWTEEFENEASKISGMRKELSDIDEIVEKMKKMIEGSSTFEGIDGEAGCSSSETEFEDSDEFDSENDEALIEREIFETINFDPDLLMKILEANAHSGVSSDEFLARFRKYQEENPASGDQPAPSRKQKGLADIEDAKVAEAKKSSRNVFHSDDDNEKVGEELPEVDDEFIYGKPAEQDKKEANFTVETSSEEEASEVETCIYEDYCDAMDRELQSELKSSFSEVVDETTNLGQSLLESMAAGVGNVGGSPVETVISGLGKKIPRPC